MDTEIKSIDILESRTWEIVLARILWDAGNGVTVCSAQEDEITVLKREKTSSIYGCGFAR